MVAISNDTGYSRNETYYLSHDIITAIRRKAADTGISRSQFASQILKRGLDALEQDVLPNDGTTADHAVTYPQLSE